MRAAAFALMACLLAGEAQAETLHLTVEQMRTFGVAAIAHGSADQALAIAEALLARDPRDSAALALKAQALREMGDLAGSENAARAAWVASETGANRYAAATALAQALSLQDHRTLAQYWLRQAAQNAPNPAARQQAMQDFNFVRSQNPLHLQFDASLRPSNNVNNGTRDTLLGYLFGVIPLYLPPQFTPLSGYAWGLGISGDYKLGETENRQDTLIFSLNSQGVILSQAAHDMAPAVQADDYAYEQIEGGWRRKAGLSFGLLTSEITLGHAWYGGSDLSNALTGNLQLDHKFNPTTDLSLSAGLTRTERLDRPQSSATEVNLQGILASYGPKGDLWQGTVDASRTVSDDPGVDNTSLGLSLGWQTAKPIMGVVLGANAGIKRTDYQNSRQDSRLSLSLNATVKRLSYLGYSPVFSIDYSKNTSNFSFDNTETTGLGISLKSNF